MILFMLSYALVVAFWVDIMRLLGIVSSHNSLSEDHDFQILRVSGCPALHQNLDYDLEGVAIQLDLPGAHA